MGASFADYLVTVHPGGKNGGIGGDGIETFLYVVEGVLRVANQTRQETLTAGGYFFSPAEQAVAFENDGEQVAVLYVYRRRYEPLGTMCAYTVSGNAKDLPWESYEEMDNCFIQNFLPTDDFGFDMNMHILKFHLGASHGYVETHVQEHGMLFLSGKAMYRLDEDWVPVQKGDYVFMDAYCPQACYGVGRGEVLTYLYSKECNRDVKL